MKIFFQYEREETIGDANGLPVHTIAFIEYDDGRFVAGDSWCHEDDMPVKDVGRKIALGRAIEQLNLSHEGRKAIWENYFARKLK